jgi:hypothetical protein
MAAGDVPVREIARRTGWRLPRCGATLKRIAASNLAWPSPEGLTDTELETRLYSNAGNKQGHRRCPEPDGPTLHRELKRKHVTLSILWNEYIEQPLMASAIRAFVNFIALGKASCR